MLLIVNFDWDIKLTKPRLTILSYVDLSKKILSYVDFINFLFVCVNVETNNQPQQNK